MQQFLLSLRSPRGDLVSAKVDNTLCEITAGHPEPEQLSIAAPGQTNFLLPTAVSSQPELLMLLLLP